MDLYTKSFYTTKEATDKVIKKILNIFVEEKLSISDVNYILNETKKCIECTQRVSNDVLEKSDEFIHRAVEI